MNKREKEVMQSQLDSEKAVLKELEKQYQAALNDINTKIKLLQADELTQSKIYQLQYQKVLKSQVESIIDKLHGDEYSTIQQYLSSSYTDAFIGTMYDIHGQGIPLVMPIDQAAAVRAVMTDSKISKGLYNALGVDTTKLKKAISSEISRGIASSMSYADIARNISNVSSAPFSRAKTIVRTEGHRIQQASTRDAQIAAKQKGADVVKQWDATLDGNTRDTHRQLDGQIREVDEPFEIGGNKAMYPGDFGDPAEDCNCRCACLTRARWAFDEDELNTLKERAEYFGLDKSDDFEDFKEKYLKAVDYSKEQDIIKSLDIDDFKMMADSKDILPEVSDVIGETIKEFESSGNMYISSANFGDFYDDATGNAALFQVFPNQYGLVEINVNSRILGGMNINKIDEMIANTKSNIPANLKEAVAHECGHAKLIQGMSVKEVKELYSDLENIHIEGISAAAFSDGAECIAEVEVMLYRNAEVPEEAKALYDKYMKGKRK